jgi:hypothetical protein
MEDLDHVSGPERGRFINGRTAGTQPTLTRTIYNQNIRCAMRSPSDIAVYGRDGQIKLLVEVKSRIGTTRDWATQLRRNIFAHGLLPKAPYFLLALPDRFYLWNGGKNTPERLSPSEIIDPNPFLSKYFQQSGISPAEINGESFEFIVSAWLNEVLSASAHGYSPEGDLAWLEHTGLFDAIRGGRIESELQV